MSGTPKVPNADIIGYDGPVGHEKAIHKTHFQSLLEAKSHPKDDPEWEYIGAGRWKRIYPKKRNMRRTSAEVQHAIEEREV